MIQGLLRAAKSKAGRIVMSAILGIGLAGLFRASCRDLSCFSFRAPAWEDTVNAVHRYGSHCYKFKPRAGPCTLEGPHRIDYASHGYV